ncbi:transglutaminase-like domain-containing protein [Singulisphaera sp. PoT]|uniref:transglutaminase-like domain-containing protein n=1 Tax=Singulisphaera sp. PoT TaxID=3411797 RepID=UPI003BF4EA01
MRPVCQALALGILLAGLGQFGFAAGDAGKSEDSWDAIYVGGKKIGFIHVSVTPVKDRGRDLLRVRVDQEFRIKRENDTMTMRTTYGTIETLAGEVLRLDHRTLASNQEMRIHGDVINNKMKIILEGSGQTQEQVIPWSSDVRGPYAAEQSLSRQPMKPGESRTLRLYIPDVNKVCEGTLTAKAPEQVLLGDGKRSLLRIDQQLKIDGRPFPGGDATLWVDSGGQVLKTRSDLFREQGGMEYYRTTREGATAGDTAEFNLLQASIVRIANKIDQPDKRQHIIYRVTLTDEDPTKVFPNDRRQTLKPEKNSKSAILEIKTAGPNEGTASTQPVDPVYLRPNAMITSQDSNVVRLAQNAVQGAVTPWDKAVKIEQWVATKLTDKNFKTAFAPASEVAENLSGDCTEHSVLVAAMCRSQGIPTKVVIGLVYADRLGGFGYHMWNEVYVNNRWVAIDAAFDQSAVDAVHVKLDESSLDGVSPVESMLAVIRVIGKLSIETLELR